VVLVLPFIPISLHANFVLVLFGSSLSSERADEQRRFSFYNYRKDTFTLRYLGYEHMKKGADMWGLGDGGRREAVSRTGK
jgi:hypothetical protein